MKSTLQSLTDFFFIERSQAQWAPMRILLSFSLFIDYFCRISYASDFFGAQNAILRKETVLAVAYDDWVISLFGDYLRILWSNDLWLYFSFPIVLLALLSLGLGFQIRKAAIAAFCIGELFTLRSPLPFIGTRYGSALLLCLAFSPLAQNLSLPIAKKNGKLSTPTSFVLTFAKLNISLFYLMAMSSKLLSSEWREGTAMYYILNLDEAIRFDPGSFLIQSIINSPTLVALMTYAVLIIQFSLFTLVWWPRLTTTAVALGITMHIGMMIFLKLGVVQLVSISALLLFLSDETVKRIFKKVEVR